MDTFIQDKEKIDLEFELIQPLGSHNPKHSCVKTSSFPLLKQDYTHYNPMQSDFLKCLSENNWDANIVVSSPTASGKTTVAEIAMVLAVFRDTKGIMLVPLRALAQEKYDDWTNLAHTFFDKNVVILTGDYSQKVTDQQLYDADIIIMTSESLDHRSRFIARNKWLLDVGMVVVDEAHLLTLESRGDRLETCLMRFTMSNRQAKISLLSATMPNVDDLEQWLTRMTSQHTIMVRSDYRPCKLESKFVFYEENPKNRRGAWDTNELLRISESLKIVKAFPKDQFIVFTGGKMWGRKALERFTQEKISARFISADENMASRINLVKEFKEGTTRVLISSSLLAYGLNLPARRVVVAHLKRGNLDVATCDLIQMAGRAGRPRFDTEGTVYFLVPKDNDSDRQIRRIRKGEEIVSQLSEKDNLMFHVVAEIFIGTINDVETFRDWYSRSLACIQDGDITSEEAEDVLTSLEKMCMIRKKEGSDRIYESTNLGKVCAWMYHSPADVFSWWQNFSKIFGQQHISDEEWAWALTNTNTWRNEYVSNAEKKFISDYVSTLEHKNIDVEGGASKWGACVCNMLKGWADDEMPALRSIASNFTFDLDRMMETLKMIDQMYGMWKKQKTFDMMKLRLRYRVSQDKVNLVRVKGIGGVYANKLFEQGITNVDDLLKEDNIVVVKGVMGKKYQTVVESAKKIKAGEVDYDNDR